MEIRIITAMVAPLRVQPDSRALLCDELLCGSTAELLEQRRDGWCHLRAAHGYTGWTEQKNLSREVRAQQWLEHHKPQLVVTGSVVDLQLEPRVRALSLATLLRGSVVLQDGELQDSWLPVELADGSRGWLPSLHLSAYPLGAGWGEAALRDSICTLALRYLGCCYRWGGKTPLGIDCSGLTSQVYLCHGIVLWRDSALTAGYAARAIPRERLAPADLLYWKGHTALYLGAGRYLHANATAGGVSQNSLLPSDPDYREDLALSLTGCGSVFPR
ncbi:MAG: SH3 domain-containing C40 family peptidase [Angelakisella sp.]